MTHSNSNLTLAHQPCPTCGSSDALAEYSDGHTFCFSCEEYIPGEEPIYTYEYLPWRGISKEVMKFYDIKTRVDDAGRPIAVLYPYPNKSNKVRRLEDKTFYIEKHAGRNIEGLFGADKFAQGGYKYVTITEGELDAASLYQAIRLPVVSVQSASTALRDCTNLRSYLNSFERIYLAFDNDTIGRDAAASVARLFDFNKVHHVKFSNRKDANEYIQAGEERILKEIWNNSKRYLPESIISGNYEFRKILHEEPKIGIPYPFKKLTEMTYGIRRGEMVLFTAQEKVGKTELMHLIEHKILKETDSNVGAIFLEEPKARHLQALAGIEIGSPIHLPDKAVEPDVAYAALQKVLKTDDRLYLYSHFGSDDPDILLDTIRFLVSACTCDYIILDHLSMVVSGHSGESDERRSLDYLSTKLEMMVKELNFALIVVMHVNDEGKTRGSRYPTKVADITITVGRDLQHYEASIRNTWYLRVLYNRFSGRTGEAGAIVFDPDTCSYTEITHAEGRTKEMESPSLTPFDLGTIASFRRGNDLQRSVGY